MFETGQFADVEDEAQRLNAIQQVLRLRERIGVVAVRGTDSKGTGGFRLRRRRLAGDVGQVPSPAPAPIPTSQPRPLVRTYQQNAHLFLAAVTVTQGMPAAEALASFATSAAAVLV